MPGRSLTPKLNGTTLDSLIDEFKREFFLSVELDLYTGVNLAIVLKFPFFSSFVIFVMLLDIEVDGFFQFNYINSKSQCSHLEILCMKRNKC